MIEEEPYGKSEFALKVAKLWNKEIEELIEVTKQLGEIKLKEVDLYNRQQILLVKMRKKWKK